MKPREFWNFSGVIQVIFAVLAGMSLAIWSTWHGPGVGGDATIYLTSAQNLARGIGLGLIQPDGSFRLLPYSAPLFPVILSPFSSAGLDLTSVARWMNIQLFGFLILLVGVFSVRISGSRRLSSLPAWLLAVSPILLPVYSWAMAEPITLALGFVGLSMVVWTLSRDKNPGVVRVGLTGIILGLAGAARYSAIAYLAVGVLMCLFWMNAPFKKRIFLSVIMGIVGSFPPGIWILTQLGQTNAFSSRSVLTGSEMLVRFSAFWPQLNSALLVWLVPASFQESAPYPIWINNLLPSIFLILLIAFTIWLVKRTTAFQLRLHMRGLWLFAGLYLLVIFSVYLTTYPPITIDNRMLSPAYVAILWIVGLGLVELIQGMTSRHLKAVLIIVCIGLVMYSGIRSVRIARQNAETGLGYNALTWQESPLIANVRDFAESDRIITNEPMAVLYLTGKIASPVAEIYFDQPVFPFTRYGDGLAGQDPAEEKFRERGDYLVLFDSLTSQLEPIYGDLANERANVLMDGLKVITTSNDGKILQYSILNNDRK